MCGTIFTDRKEVTQMKKNLSAQYAQYKRATATTLRDVYTSWSAAKERAYDWCLEKMRRQDGENFRIISANTFQFTCGREYPDPETGVLMFDMETASNSYEWEVIA